MKEIACLKFRTETGFQQFLKDKYKELDLFSIVNRTLSEDGLSMTYKVEIEVNSQECMRKIIKESNKYNYIFNMVIR